MGLINFVKAVGASIGLNNNPEAESLKKTLDSFGLGTEQVNVKVNGDKVTLSGEVKNQEALEKAVLAVGNAMGIASVDTSQVVVEGSKQNVTNVNFYQVKKGDTLWKIAEAVYGKGNGEKNKMIFEANKPMLTSPDKIYPGQLLRIPKLEG